MEMVVENGRGYVPASEHSTRDHEIGIIPVDAVFSPVVRVRYEVEETRVGQKTNYDKLTLEVWTDGSIGPEMAVVEAAKIFRKHLNPFVQYTELGRQVHADRSRRARFGRSSTGSQIECSRGRFAAECSSWKLSRKRRYPRNSRVGPADRGSIAGDSQFR